MYVGFILLIIITKGSHIRQNKVQNRPSAIEKMEISIFSDYVIIAYAVIHLASNLVDGEVILTCMVYFNLIS